MSESNNPMNANPVNSGNELVAPVKAEEMVEKAPVQAVKPREAKQNDKDLSQFLFNGRNELQYAYIAHYMGIGLGPLAIVFGFFAVLWYQHPWHYQCKIMGWYEIHESFILASQGGTCDPITDVCCDKDSESTIDDHGSEIFGILWIIYGLFSTLFESIDYGWGLWFPVDTFCFKNHFSPLGWFNIAFGFTGFSITTLYTPGICSIFLGIARVTARIREEAGDGGRAKAAAIKKREAAHKKPEKSYMHRLYGQYINLLYDDAKFMWIIIYTGINVMIFVVTLAVWESIIESEWDQLRDGSADPNCDSDVCEGFAIYIRTGPISPFVSLARAFGMMLNFNCSMILLPVVKLLLRRLSDIGEAMSEYSRESSWFGAFFARPLVRYVPLSKNLAFHKMCAGWIMICTIGHVIAHLSNLFFAYQTTFTYLHLLNRWGWRWAPWFSGAMVTIAMFFIYSGCWNVVKLAKYEVFFNSHHWFIIFFGFMIMHGPIYIFWFCIPLALYIWEKVLVLFRTTVPFKVIKADWHPPVLALYFQPLIKDGFVHQEGQFLNLRCPTIHETEFHPFTISSAPGDSEDGPMICIATGEEVFQVPKPDNWPEGRRWAKYCPLTRTDWKSIPHEDYLERSEVGYADYVSVHIKVHGWDQKKARTWTHKFKNYLESIAPINKVTGTKFPMYFNTRDFRGDMHIGRHLGPNNLPIIQIDGPHSAPAQRYRDFNTCLVVGAGIGLTPCIAILTSMIRYRWRRNFNPEILHYYWLVRHNEIHAYQWHVHLLANLNYELKRAKKLGLISPRFYAEMNIYVTGYKPGAKKKPEYDLATDDRTGWEMGTVPEELLEVPPRTYPNADVEPTFTADELFSHLLHPTVSSKEQAQRMREPRTAPNRLQNLWIWSGRPEWDQIFEQIKSQRQDSTIGVCFCGAPVIGKELKKKCEKYSSKRENVLFSLQKENF